MNNEQLIMVGDVGLIFHPAGETPRALRLTQVGAGIGGGSGPVAALGSSVFICVHLWFLSI